MHLLTRSLCVVLAPALLCVAALAQETGEKPRLPALGPNAGDGGRAEMVGLFHKVERRLGEIDKLLYDASTGHSALQSQKESGIADLIKSSSAKSKEVTRDIDKILELAAQAGSMSSSDPSGGKPQKPGDGAQGKQGSPLDGKQGDPSAREQTPEKPGGGKPDKGGEKPEPSDAQNGDPKSPKESNAAPENHKSGPPPRLETAKTDAAQANERWGDLPVQVRDLFRTQGGGEMPAQYRDWIDAYYRRLNQRP
jgi:hypothetical protein